jgi:hypothetical protein
MPMGSGAPVLLSPRSSEAEVVLDRAQGSGAFDEAMGLGRGGNCCPRCLSRPRPLRKARVGWRLTLGFERLTCCQRL